MEACPLCGLAPLIRIDEEGRHVHEFPIDVEAWRTVVGSKGE